MSEAEIIDTYKVLVGAGSERTPTTLAAATYFICSHADVLNKLKAEVRPAFKSEDEIDINSVQNLTYMLAVLKETMRIYLPVPIALARRTPVGGSPIAGEHIPEGVS